MKSKYKAKRLRRGHYLYRGYEIMCVGYYPPEKRVCWECIEKDGISGFGHGYTLSECKRWIDIEIEEEQKKNSIINEESKQRPVQQRNGRHDV